jgi:hypothetical protein
MGGTSKEDKAMFVRAFTLSLATLLIFGLAAETAQADHRKRHRRIIVEDEYYPGPAFIREVPGLRIFFGDYALSEEEFDQLYGSRRRDRYDRGYDERYYEPEPAPPRRRSVAPEQQNRKKTVAKPAKPSSNKETASAVTGKQTDQKKALRKSTPAAASALSCEKATSVVTGYGFSSVTPSSCNGKVYAFNATRDGKSFAIKLDSASGELTEVKKLP